MTVRTFTLGLTRAAYARPRSPLHACPDRRRRAALVADAVARGLRREGLAVDVAHDGDGRAASASASSTTTWSSSTATCPACTATTSAARSSPPSGPTRILMLTAAADVDDRVDGPGARRRRLPAQAVRLRRAGRAHPRPGAPRTAGRCRPVLERAATSRSTPRRRGRPRAAGRSRSTPKEFGVLEVLLRAAGRRRQRRGAARARLGRARRPVHQHGARHGDDAAAQARRARPLIETVIGAGTGSP